MGPRRALCSVTMVMMPASGVWPHSSEPQTADAGIRLPHYRIPVCLFLPGAVAPRVSVSLNDL